MTPDPSWLTMPTEDTTGCAFCQTEGCEDESHSDPHHTDTGNAIRFVKQHRGGFLYCYPLGTWFHYDGRVWRADAMGTAMRAAQATVAHMYVEAAHAPTENERKKLAAHAMKSESDPRLTALLKQARPHLAIAPDHLDADRWLLNVLNGTLDLRTRVLQPHRATDLLTKLAPVDYDPDAHSPLWQQVLEHALPDPAVRRFVQKLAGYTLVGVTPEDIFCILHGLPRTGKGTIQDAISVMLGDYAVTAALDSFGERWRSDPESPRPNILRLNGARMVSIYETDQKLRLSAVLIKSLAGSDPITVRGLHANPIEFYPQMTIWVATNHRPIVPSDDDALWERLREVPFTVPIAEADRKPEIRADLKNPLLHGSAILAWAVEGCRLWQEEGLCAPPAIVTATQDYRDHMDPLHTFLDECCLLGPSYWASSAAVRSAYEQWAKETGEAPVNGKRFRDALRAHGCTRKKTKVAQGWQGVGVITDEVPPTGSVTDDSK